MSFSERLKEASRLIDQRQLEHAVTVCEQAIEVAHTASERAQAHQKEGIALRLMGNFTEAIAQFIEAKALAIEAEDTALVGRILRDRGMVYIDRAVAEHHEPEPEAIGYLAESHIILSEAGEYVEAAATRGFIGRLYFIVGYDLRAISTMECAHRDLHGKQDTYELNNLIWLARVSPFHRYQYALRGLFLSAKLKQPKRGVEYLILLAGGERLYRLAKEKLAQ